MRSSDRGRLVAAGLKEMRNLLYGMVEAAEAFFKADEAAEASRARRDELQANAQRVYAQAIRRHVVITEDYNKLLGKRRIKRAKANEASCWQADATADSSVVAAQMLDARKSSFRFTEVQIEQLHSEAAMATNESGAPTPNRLACLEEDWNMPPCSDRRQRMTSSWPRQLRTRQPFSKDGLTNRLRPSRRLSDMWRQRPKSARSGENYRNPETMIH